MAMPLPPYRADATATASCADPLPCPDARGLRRRRVALWVLLACAGAGFLACMATFAGTDDAPEWWTRVMGLPHGWALERAAPERAAPERAASEATQ